MSVLMHGSVPPGMVWIRDLSLGPATALHSKLFGADFPSPAPDELALAYVCCV